MDIVTVSSKGQIAIPKKIRDELGPSAGTQLSAEIREGKVGSHKGPGMADVYGAPRAATFCRRLNGRRLWRSCVKTAVVESVRPADKHRELAERFRRLLGTIAMSVVMPNLDAVWVRRS